MSTYITYMYVLPTAEPTVTQKDGLRAHACLERYAQKGSERGMDGGVLRLGRGIQSM